MNLDEARTIIFSPNPWFTSEVFDISKYPHWKNSAKEAAWVVTEIYKVLKMRPRWGKRPKYNLDSVAQVIYIMVTGEEDEKWCHHISRKLMAHYRKENPQMWRHLDYSHLHWQPEIHWQFDSKFRKNVFLLLLASRDPNSPFALIGKPPLLLIIKHLAAAEACRYMY
jgi:hypothetical protein